MRIVELKSQTSKIIYKPALENLKVGDFVSFTENDLTIIAQVYKIMSSDVADDFNQADLIFVLTRKYEKTSLWNGELVSANAAIQKTAYEIINDYIKQSSDAAKLLLGKHVSFEKAIEFDFKQLQAPVFIGFDRPNDNFLLLKTLAENFNRLEKKLVVFDYKGIIELENSKKVVCGENLKLPLNKTIIENLSSKIIEGVSLESKIVIEDILMELSQFADSNKSGFIPVSNLINTIDNFYKQTKIAPLLLLKNKLLHFKRLNLFADKISEQGFMDECLQNNNVVVCDLSNIPQEWRNEFLLNFLRHKDDNLHIFLPVDNANYDNNIMNYLLFKAKYDNIQPIISSNYRHLAFDSIFDFSRNSFLFKTYNSLKKRFVLSDILQSLPENHFVLTGMLTKNLLLSINLCDEEKTLLSDENIQAVSDMQEVLTETQDISPDENNNITYYEINSEETPKGLTIDNLSNMINKTINVDANAGIVNNQNIESNTNLQEENNIAENDNPGNFAEENDVLDIVTNDAEITDITDILDKSDEEQVLEIPQVSEDIVEVSSSREEEINVENNEPIQLSNDSNILEDNIEEVRQDTEFEEINTVNEVSQSVELHEEDIINLVEDIDNGTEDDNLLFEEVKSDDDNLEDLADDDLDFLNDTDDNSDSLNFQNNDDDLLDLIDTDLQEHSEQNISEEISQDTSSLNKDLPIYDANYDNQNKKNNIAFSEGDLVKHSKYGVGTIKKITSHGDKHLCHINFDNFGRRLLDPEISQLEKID